LFRATPRAVTPRTPRAPARGAATSAGGAADSTPSPRCTAGASAQSADNTFPNLAAAYATNKNVSHDIFQAAVAAANLTDAVLNVSSFTMFIPTDAVSAPAPLAGRPRGRLRARAFEPVDASEPSA
jgi:uncharacterized surface protein with fasciclin (FAS1) repeats